MSGKTRPPAFSKLWDKYPTTRIGGGCARYENQCAMRMSAALAAAGMQLSGYGDPTCGAGGVTHARGAESLANHLWRTIGRPRIYKAGSDPESLIAGQTGIVFFKDIRGFRAGRGDHIDLWKKNKTKTGAYFSSAKQVWFWKVP